MKKGRKRFGRFLAACMSAMVCLSGFIGTGSLVKAAEENKETSNEMTTPDSYADVYLYVPETIYLKPDLESQVKAKQYDFQWYVDSEIDRSAHTAIPRIGEQTAGDFYFYYENAENVSISYRWMSYAGTIMDGSGSAITVSGKSLKPGQKTTFNGNCIDTQITAGTCPLMSADNNCYYIEWNIQFQDKIDHKTKTALAYTYVYKPNIQPVGAGVTCNNFFWDNFYNSHISWVSGIHSIGETDPRLVGAYYPVVGGRYSLLPFASSNPTSEKQDQLYIQFPGYFDTNTNNTGANRWTTAGSSNYFNVKSFHFYKDEHNPAGVGDCFAYTMITAPASSITIDTSRYTNLNQIPNLSCGMMVTDDEDSDDGAILHLKNIQRNIVPFPLENWININSQSFLEPRGQKWYKCYFWFESEKMIDIGGIIIDRKKFWDERETPVFGDSSSEDDGLKYLGKWNYVIKPEHKNSTGWVPMVSLYWNRSDGDHATTRATIPVKLIMHDKSLLRSAVANAQKYMAEFAMDEEEKSFFYDSYSKEWMTFDLVYKGAQKMLTALDYTPEVIVDGTSYTSCDAVAKLLNDAVATLAQANRKHFIHSDVGEHGKVSVIGEEFVGKEVRVYTSAEERYELDTIEIKDASGNEIEAKNEYGGVYSFVMADTDVRIKTSYKEKHIHKEHLTKVEELHPTCTEEGYEEHYECSCGRWYRDSEAEKYIVGKEVISIKPLGHASVVVPGKPATCTEAGYSASEKCSRCGEITWPAKEIPALGHKLADGYISDSTGHWHRCSRCDYVEGKSGHVSSGPATEDTAEICTVCGYVIHPQKEHVHDNLTLVPSDISCKSGGYESYYLCRCGQWFKDSGATIPITDHSSIYRGRLLHIDETIPGKASTCTETGLTSGIKCELCGEILIPQMPMEALGHAEVIDKAVEASCNEKGLTEGRHCSRCGEVFTAREEIPALGHDEVTGEAVEATCTEDGYTESKYCSRCNEVFKTEEVIPALGHDEITEGGEAPTCGSPGLTPGVYCSRCNAVLKLPEAIPSPGHDPVAEAGKEATCTEEGLSDAVYCSRCNVVIAEHAVIPAKGHMDDDKDYRCDVCGAILGYKVIQGNEGKWTKGSEKEYVIASDADFDKFLGVVIDRVEVDKDHYTAKSGSTVITLKGEYLESLSPGQHVFRIESSDGFAQGAFEVVKADAKPTPNPKPTPGPKPTPTQKQKTAAPTGDASPVVPMAGMLALASGALAAFAAVKIRKRKESK